MQIQSSESSYQAKAILGAWQTGDEARLRAQLDCVKRVSKQGFDSGEAERMELLAEIARELGSSNQPFTDDSSQVCCNLLEHLAISGVPVARRRAIPVCPRARAAAATVLQ